jgi:hypothetical protein
MHFAGNIHDMLFILSLTSDGVVTINANNESISIIYKLYVIMHKHNKEA